MTNEHLEFTPPTDEEIATYAFHLWDAEGRQPGRDLDYWLQAKAHLTMDRVYEAGLLSMSGAKDSANSSKPVLQAK